MFRKKKVIGVVNLVPSFEPNYSGLERHKIKELPKGTKTSLVDLGIDVLLVICESRQMGEEKLRIPMFIRKARSQYLYPVVLCLGADDDWKAIVELFRAGAWTVSAMRSDISEIVDVALAHKKKRS